ncbi:serine/threonine protein kinase [Paraliomyxa miuraensis]|uniref:serine/threonine protein kinase n=1 Tax=Paraliomyxa miuraensis TaxID=376150 RepID=UPI00225019E2|nr:protein kinase [Paraliomyxa miuraensis]MCX4246015.1 protein kinase [Paraliomyxa miuraensis]
MTGESDHRDEIPRSSPPWGSDITPLTEVCGGQYVLLHEIAHSESSIVYRAKPTGSRDAIAFKLLRPQLAGDETEVSRFRREVELLRRIDHPNVVRLLDHGTIEDGREFVALELLVGRTLAKALAEIDRMSPERVCRIARQIGRALRAMHMAGVIHRDLRPNNIMLIGPEDAERVKLVEFTAVGDVGAPVRRVKDQSGRAVDAQERRRYRAPEQLRQRPPQPSMDVFALGVIMYEMLAGEHPFAPPEPPEPPRGKARRSTPTIRTKAFDAPEVLLGLVSDCIEGNPADRPSSMDEVLERIDKALLWMGVVPHEVAGGETTDEDRRTQLWAVAEASDPPASGGAKRRGPSRGPAVPAASAPDDFELDLVDDDDDLSIEEPTEEEPSPPSPSRARKPWEPLAGADAEDAESRSGGTWSGMGVPPRAREDTSRARAQEQARRAQEEAARLRAKQEEEAQRVQEEIRKAQAQARKAQEEARRAQEEARKAQEEAARIRAQQEEEARRVQEEARKAQEEARRAQEEARRVKEQARRERERARRDGPSTGSAPRIDLDELRDRERARRDGPSTGSVPRIDLDELRERERAGRDAWGRDNRDTPDSDSGSAPRIDLEELERESAPTGPRFVVDTVAWTKQQPSAEPAKGRKRKVGADGRDSRASQSRTATGSYERVPPGARTATGSHERVPPGARTATGSHERVPPGARPATGSHERVPPGARTTSGTAASRHGARARPTAAHAPVDPLPRWSFLLVVVLLAGLAYAAFLVWTQ